jgi:ABC-2 type transport system permease protein
MAVYEHTYKQYLGKLTPEWSRFLIIPRHAFGDVFKSKLFTAFFVVCFLPLVVEMILIYLHHNFTALTIFRTAVQELVPVDASFFQTFANIQAGFAFFLTLLVGPPLVARDLRNNALPLYFCRPFSRTEYVLGKMSVLLILLSAITWVPQLFLFAFQSYLEGPAWFAANLSIGVALFILSVVWILVLALLSQAVSAVVKWRVIASGTLLGLFFVPSAFAAMVNGLFLTRAANIISPVALMSNISAGLFGTFTRASGHYTDWRGAGEIVINEPPLWASWFVLFLICAVCLALLSWKVKAYEVVR